MSPAPIPSPEHDPILAVLLDALITAVKLEAARDHTAPRRLHEARAALAAHGLPVGYVQGVEKSAREAARQPVPCRTCNSTGEVVARSRYVGNGAINDDYDTCPSCGGNGFVMRSAA